MSDANSDSDRPRVLVPITVLDGETVPQGIVDLLAAVDAVVLGYHEVPEQTAPGQARMQFEDRAQELLDGVAEQFRDAGGTVETRLVFTHDTAKSIERVSDELGCDATLVVRPTPAIDDVYVALESPAEAAAVLPVLGPLLAGGDAHIRVRYFGAADDAEAAATLADAVDRLTATGVSPARVDGELVDESATVQRLVDDATGTDLVVIAEPPLSIGEVVFGDTEDRIAAQVVAPVLVVVESKGDGQGASASTE